MEMKHWSRMLQGWGTGLLAALGGACLAAGAETFMAERLPDADPAARVGTLRCWPQDGDPASCIVRVETADGRVLPHRVLWWGEGDPLDLRFDCGGGLREVVVRIEPGGGAAVPASAPGWEDRAGVVLETRRRASEAADSWAAVSSHWEQAGAPLGRSEVRQVCDGMHRHGPTADFLSHYRGWFQIAQQGRYGFAAVSDDASVLLINGGVVAEWTGWHGVDAGRRGEYQGWVRLAPGLHRLDYYNVQRGEGFTVLAAWRPPDGDSFAPMPPEAFVPTAAFEALCVRTAPDAPAMRWRPDAHVRVPGGVLLGMNFAVLPTGRDEGAHWRWRFPDGVVREGAEVRHAFCREGLLPVTLETWREGRRDGAATVAVRVRPDWTQRAESDPALAAQLVALFPDPVS